jgi:hypothetical protein
MPSPGCNKYGLVWKGGMSALEIEMDMIRRGGRIVVNGVVFGNGMFYHMKELQSLLWPKEKVWHRWNELQLKSWLEHRTMGVIGPSSSGKSMTAATDHLAEYYCFPNDTTILICSTTKERLQDRIFGEIKRYHRMAKERFWYLPGYTIEGRMRIVTEDAGESTEGRDFRNGIIGVPCLQGGQYRGISEFIGIKNRRVRIVLDELQMLPPAVLLALSNLDKNEDFKATGLGNPKDTTDALGVFCEPTLTVGGWEGGVDQVPKTKTWDTRRPDGICVQLVGTDSPNLNNELGIPIINQDAIDRDIAQYGKESLQFSMMNQGMMPRGQGTRRVLTRQFCYKNKAMEKAIWRDLGRTKLASLDAAYKGVGGDRCVLMFFDVGYEPVIPDKPDFTNIISQSSDRTPRRQVIELTETMLVPIDITSDVEAEDQIALFVKEQCSTRRVEPQNFFYESGMRTGLVSAFCRLWSVQTNPIDCGGPASERMVSSKIQTPCNKYYSKLITEFWFTVRLIVEAQQFRGMTESVMTEGCSREWKMVSGNRIEVESKRDMKEKNGKSPDLFDCLAIGCEGAKRLGFTIDSKILTAPSDSNPKWKEDLRRRAYQSRRESDLNHAA